MVRIHSAFKCGITIVCCILFMGTTASGAASDSPAPQTAQIVVTGTVIDAGGLPVIGASVIEAGTTNGVITDVDGNFKITTAAGATVNVSCIGFADTSFPASDKPVTVTLSEDVEMLSEVVVTALGIKREQKALSYNVQEVKGDQLTKVKDANFVNALSGKVAGVVVNSSAAGVGGATRIVMRGTKSLEKDDNALYVIDGIPMFTVNSGDTKGGTMANQPGSSNVADINPEDIESISILTGPSAAALYGSSAANGVVLITTKKGAEGKVKITYNNSTTFQNPMMLPEFQNTYGNVKGSAQSWGEKMASPTSFNPSQFFRTGFNEMNSVTLSVGSQKNQTYASVSSTNSKGTLPNSGYNRYNFAIRNTTNFAKDKLTLDLGAQYIIQDSKNLIGGGQYHNPLTSLYLFPRGENFAEVQNYERFDAARGFNVQWWPAEIFGSDLNVQNPYWVMNRMNTEIKKDRYMFNASLKWDIAKWVNVIGRVRMDNTVQTLQQKNYASTTTLFTEGSDKGFYEHTDTKDGNVYADVIANFNKSFANDRLSLIANLGGSVNDTRENIYHMEGGLDKVANFFHVGNISKSTMHRNEEIWHDQVQSVFASVELSWDRMVYLTATGRNDWDSRLAFTSKNSYFYPSVGASWIISELLPKNRGLSYLKVRASWAEVASAPSRYLTLKQYEYSSSTDSYELPKVHYDTNLKPENTRSWEIGMNAKFIDGKINLDATFYKSNTFNQTFYVDASASSGYKQNIVQTGNIMNMGVEAGLGYSDGWMSDKLRFSTNFTFTWNRNQIISLANGAVNPDTGETIKMDYYSKGVLGVDNGGPQIRLVEGGSMGDLYINQRLKRDASGNIVVNEDGKPVKESVDYYKIGSVLPDFHLGWNIAFSYAGLDLNVQLNGRFGGTVISDTQAYLDRYGVSAVTADARNAGGVKISGSHTMDTQGYYSVVSTLIGENYSYDATNVRLAEVSLAYNLPRKWFRDKIGLSVGFVGRNLCLLYCNAPFDPENVTAITSNFYQGVDFFNQPSQRTLGFNIKLTY